MADGPPIQEIYFSNLYFDLLTAATILNTLIESLLTAASNIFSPFDKRISDISFTSPFKINPLVDGGTDVKALLLPPRRKQP